MPLFYESHRGSITFICTFNSSLKSVKDVELFDVFRSMKTGGQEVKLSDADANVGPRKVK